MLFKPISFSGISLTPTLIALWQPKLKSWRQQNFKITGTMPERLCKCHIIQLFIHSYCHQFNGHPSQCWYSHGKLSFPALLAKGRARGERMFQGKVPEKSFSSSVVAHIIAMKNGLSHNVLRVLLKIVKRLGPCVHVCKSLQWDLIITL